MRAVETNPYAVVLRRKKVPMGLLAGDGVSEDADKLAKVRRGDLLEAEPYETTFGGAKGGSRKRPKLPEGVSSCGMGDEDALAALFSNAKSRNASYDEVNGGLADARASSSEDTVRRDGTRDEARGDLFLKGQSKRIWAEFYKVLDCSDVVLHVVDARDVPGTVCKRVVSHLKERASHKHLIFVLNKCDLVPNWAVRKWLRELGKTAPTLAFRASETKPFGKGALLDVLRQFAHLHADAKQISVGVVGLPNVGKSSVINSLRAKAVCKVAPVPGETKVWQYITLTRRVNLIDSPGVVYADPKSLYQPGVCDDVESVLRGIVRAERLPDPAAFASPLLRRLKPEHVAAAYEIPFAPPVLDGRDAKADDDRFDRYAEDFVRRLAFKMGRLMKGGEPDTRTVCTQMINDWQRGKLPHFVPPPDAEVRDPKTGKLAADLKADLEMDDAELAEGFDAEMPPPTKEVKPEVR